MTLRRLRQLFSAASITAAAACSTSSGPSGSGAPVQGRSEEAAGHSGGPNAVAPARLVVGGQYTDRRFLDMMAAHHAAAVAMARAELESFRHPDLRELARAIVDTQSAELEEIRNIKQQEYGRTDVPLQMDPDDVANTGMAMADALDKHDMDLAFIDAMMPHHAEAIEMASVARMRSASPRIVALCRKIIDAQAREIGTLIAWRRAWFENAP